MPPVLDLRARQFVLQRRESGGRGPGGLPQDAHPLRLPLDGRGVDGRPVPGHRRDPRPGHAPDDPAPAGPRGRARAVDFGGPVGVRRGPARGRRGALQPGAGGGEQGHHGAVGRHRRAHRADAEPRRRPRDARLRLSCEPRGDGRGPHAAAPYRRGEPAVPAALGGVAGPGGPARGRAGPGPLRGEARLPGGAPARRVHPPDGQLRPGRGHGRAALRRARHREPGHRDDEPPGALRLGRRRRAHAAGDVGRPGDAALRVLRAEQRGVEREEPPRARAHGRAPAVSYLAPRQGPGHAPPGVPRRAPAEPDAQVPLPVRRDEGPAAAARARGQRLHRGAARARGGVAQFEFERGEQD
mmetsp:Transcript_18733/g.65026  ORF Transcript_18733/g.65026 Transcript_18733/m.65026 type:complete len:355 (-) Transcript_18733:1956-3020(-)